MPDSLKLSFLSKLRYRQNINLEEMAKLCGLYGRRSRISVGKWEQGKTVPNLRHRLIFLDYMVRHLNIEFNDLLVYWQVLEEEWGWKSLSNEELEKYFFLSGVDHSEYQIPYQLPPSVVSEFIGRENEISSGLNSLLEAGFFFISGPPGIGKTQLASKIVWQVWETTELRFKFPDGFLYFQFKENLDELSFYDHLISTYKENPGWNFKETAKKALAGRKALIYLDAIENANLSIDEIKDVVGNNSLIITSRRRISNSFFLREFTNQEASQLFYKIQPNLQIEESILRDTFLIIGKTPLAISIFSKHLKLNDNFSIEEMQNHQELLNKKDSIFDKLYGFLGELSEGEKIILSRLAIFANYFIPERFISSLFKDGSIPSEFDSLKRRGLIYESIENNEKGIRYSHSLIYEYAQKQSVTEKIIFQTLDFLLADVRQLKVKEDFSSMENLHPHVLKFIKLAFSMGNWSVVKNLVNQVDWYLDKSGHWAEWLEITKMALNASIKTNADNEVSNYLHNIGVTYNHLGESKKALSYYLHALDKVSDSSNKSRILCDMGISYKNIGEYDSAFEAYEQGLEISREIHDLNGQANNLCNIGVLKRKLGNPSEALQYAMEALNIRRKLDSNDELNSDYGSLGLIYRDLGNRNKAEECFIKALQLSREKNDKRSQSVHLVNLATIYSRSGDIEKSLELNLEALEIDTKLGDRVGEAITLYNIATDYIKLSLKKIERSHQLFLQTDHPYSSHTENALKKTQSFLKAIE